MGEGFFSSSWPKSLLSTLAFTPAVTTSCKKAAILGHLESLKSSCLLAFLFPALSSVLCFLHSFPAIPDTLCCHPMVCHYEAFAGWAPSFREAEMRFLSCNTQTCTICNITMRKHSSTEEFDAATSQLRAADTGQAPSLGEARSPLPCFFFTMKLRVQL